MKVFLAGPIDYWWNENWNTPAHETYKSWREHVTRLLIEAGHLVYRPDRAWKGAWDETAQVVNDAALGTCDVFIHLTPHGVPAYGTEAERQVAENLGLRIAHAPPVALHEIADLVVPLPDPYGAVNRKSYTKG